MDKTFTPGKIMFFVGIGFLGIMNFFIGDVAISWPRPLPAPLKGLNAALAYTTGILSLVASMLGLHGKYKIQGSCIIIFMIIIVLLPRHLFNHWRDYINGFKSLVFLSGGLLIIASTDRHKAYSGLFNWFAIISLSLFFLCCGYTHFAIADFVKTLIPGYIPFKLFFTYLTGTCLIAAAIGLSIKGNIRRWAAFLSGIMILGWFILLHLPKAFAAMNNYGEWVSVGESFTLSGICFMICGISYNDTFIQTRQTETI
jgi:uncharacterized membrane protein YphA (DoxX/SURF4 family)